MCKILGCLIDVAWYIEHSPQGVLSISSALAVEHYITHAAEICWPPNLYFMEHKDQLYDQGKCIMSTLVKGETSEGVFKLLDGYAKTTPQDFQVFARQGVKKTSGLISVLNADYPHLSSIITQELAKCSLCIGALSDVSFFENWLELSPVPEEVLFILIEHATLYDGLPSTFIRLSAALLEDRFAKHRPSLMSKLAQLASNGEEFPSKVFSNIEKLIFKDGEHVMSAMRVVVFGIKEGLHVPSEQSISWCKLLLEHSLRESDASLASLALDALTVTALAWFTEADKVDQVVTYIIENEYRFVQIKYTMRFLFQMLVEGSESHIAIAKKIHEHDSSIPKHLLDRLSVEPVQIKSDIKSAQEFLLETLELNANNPSISQAKLLELVEYAKVQLPKVHEHSLILKLNDARLIIFSRQTPIEIQQHELHVYRKDGKLFIGVFDKSGTLINAPILVLNEAQVARINKIISGKARSAAHDLDAIYNATGYLAPWSDEQFLSWTNKNKVIDDSNIAEVISVLSYAYYLTKAKQQFFMRDQQIIAVLMLFKSQSGRILEIETGGGKSAIIAIFGAIRAMLKLPTHVITTSGALAIRDAKGHRSFFSKLGLQAKDNLPRSNEPEGIRACYDANPLYCDMRQLLGDFLRNLDETVMRGGDVNALVLDEIDALLIELAIASGTKVQLAAGSPGFEYLRGIQQATSGYFENIKKMLSTMEFKYNKEFEAYCRPDAEGVLECLSIEQIYSWLQSAIESYILDASSSMPTPSHLREFLVGHANRWAESVIKALSHNVDEEYTLYETKPNTTQSIIPIDLKNGVLQTSLKWSDGLHQYLQLKHALQHTAEGLTNLFISYYGYFLKYKGNIFGLTGTIGASWHQKFLFEVYKVDSIKLPTFAESKRSSMHEIIAPNENEWLKAIVNETMQVAGKDKRAVLIVAPTISMMKTITAGLSEAKYAGAILQYFNGLEQTNFFDRLIQPGDVIVATNAAGRGVDPEISRAVERNGGLHVIMPSFSDSLRVYQQGIGRSARKGQRGSDRLIINVQDHPELSLTCNLTCLLKMRDEHEIQELIHMQICSLPGYVLEAELFAQHVRRMRADTSATGFDLVLASPDATLQDRTLYLYSQGSSIFMQSENMPRLNVTEPFTMLDVTVLEHIRSTFGRASSALNSQAHEMAHFIAANFSQISNPYILGRIIVRYENSWKDSKAEMTFPGFCPHEQSFLEGLVKKPASFKLLMQAKYQELYRLWREDRTLYNKRSYVEHRKERFGIFYKDNRHLMLHSPNCNSTDVAGEQQQANHRAEQLNNESSVFFSAESNNTNIANSAYLLHEAYTLERIEAEQPQRRVGKVNFRGAYGFIKSLPRCEVASFEPPPESEGILASIFGLSKKVYSGIMSLVPGEAKRVFTSLFEAKVELQDLYLFDTLNAALDLTLKAVSADSFFNWWPHNALAYMRLRHDGDGITQYSQGAEAVRVIRAFAQDTSNTLHAFNQYVPLLESRLVYLLQQRITNTSAPLAIQMRTEIEMYKGQIRTLQHNLNRVKEAADNFRSDAPSMLRVGRTIDLVDLVNHTAVTEFAEADTMFNHTPAVNFTQLMARNHNVPFYARNLALEMYAQGAFAFEVEVIELHDDRDWTETVLSGFLGVLFIVIGVALMPGAGVFMTSFATSIIAGGVADIVGSIAAFIRGSPIQMDQFFKGKVISLAASLIAAGVLKGLSEIKKLDELFKISDTAAKFSSTFKEVLPLYLTAQFAISAATQLAYAAISKQAERYVEKNSGAIKADSQALVAEILKRQYDQHLRRILAYDLLTGQRDKAQMIEAQAQSITRDYSHRFRSTGAQTARQATGQVIGALAGGFGPTGAALGTAVGAGIEVGLGVVKFSKAAEDFEPNLIASIENVAAGTPTTAELMRLHLARNANSLISTQATAIMTQLATVGFVTSGEIQYSNCDQLATLPLNTFASLASQLIDSCTEVNRLMSRDAQAAAYSQLQENLAQTLFASLQDILKMDIASPLSSVGASGAAGMLTSPIQKHLEEAKARILAASDPKEHTEEYQTTNNRKPDSLDLRPVRGKGKASSKDSAKTPPGTSKKISYKKFKDSILSREEWKATKLYFEFEQASAAESAAFEGYLKAKYAHYKSGQPIDTIGASSMGFELHRLSTEWQELAAQHKWLGKSTDGVGKGIDKLHDILIKPVMGVLGDAAVVGGHVLHDTVGATKCLLSSGCNLRAQAHAEIDSALAQVFAPIARAIDEWKNDLTPPQREVMLPLLDRAGKTLDFGGLTAVGKAAATGAVRTVLPASARTLQAAMSKTAELGSRAVRTPIARAAAQALDKAADTLKASTAAVKAECASVARNLNDLAAGLGMPNPAFASIGHAGTKGIASLEAAARYKATAQLNRPTIPPAVTKPTALQFAEVKDSTLKAPVATTYADDLATQATELKPLGLGSTGRTVPNSIKEQMVMKEIMKNPGMGEALPIVLNDPRWIGWSKMAWYDAGVEVHYVAKFENGILKAVDDFKFAGRKL